MYEQCFNLSSRPFTSTPFVKHYFAGHSIQQSLESASQCVERGTGPVTVVGEAGTGKSLLLAMLEDQFRTRFTVVNLACASMNNRLELLQNILYELQLPYRDMSEGELRLSLMDFLKPSPDCPNGILVLVDEAHLLPTDLLDEIRLITNYVRDGQPRVRLVMAGTVRLEENLNEPRLVSLNQRIAARCYLASLSQSETARYVIDHIDRAGGNGEKAFDASALRAIHDVTDGCPRYINQVAEHAMILAATRGETSIGSDQINEAWHDVQSISGTLSSSVSPTAASSTSMDDGDWTVIEFGSLDDQEPAPTLEASAKPVESDAIPAEETDSEIDSLNQSPTFDSAVEPSQGQLDETPQQKSDLPQPESDTTSSAEPAAVAPTVDSSKSAAAQDQPREVGINSRLDQLVKLVDQADGEIETEPFTESTNSSGKSNAREEKHSDLATGPTQSSVESEFDNPFEEEFAEEEDVIDTYGRMVIAQNEASLAVTSAQLSVITPIDEFNGGLAAHEDFEPTSKGDSPNDGDTDCPSKQSTGVEATTPDESVESDSLVQSDAASEDNRASDPLLDEVEQQAQTILQTLSSNPESVSCETDETKQEEVTNRPRALALSEIATQQDAPKLESHAAEAVSPGSPSKRNSKSEDDRDMIIVAHQEDRLDDRMLDNSIPFPSNAISKGEARRVEYQELFDRLRGLADD